MTALSKIREAGFSVDLNGDSFKITPSSKLTENQRDFLKSHKVEIISELKSEGTIEHSQHSANFLGVYRSKTVSQDQETFVKCGDCLFFRSLYKHGKGSGKCSGGGSYGKWSESLHQCEIFNKEISA